jgi:hypothetical protein
VPAPRFTLRLYGCNFLATELSGIWNHCHNGGGGGGGGGVC